MDLNESISRACEGVPGLVRAALAVLPEGFLIGGIGAASTFDHEPLVRSATHCLAPRPAPAVGARSLAPFVEYLFANDDQWIVIQAGRTDPRLVLAVVCTREPNPAFVLASTRQAIRALEISVDLASLGV